MYLPEAEKDFVWTVIGSPWGWLAIWLVVINLVTFFVFGLDKLKAKYKEKHEKTRRIPEKTLFILAAIGGSVGALLGMRVWRHKTLHKSFRYFDFTNSHSHRIVSVLERDSVRRRLCCRENCFTPPWEQDSPVWPPF